MPSGALAARLAANDALIQGPVLDNGRRIARERATIYADALRTWARAQVEAAGYDRPFAVVALGGTGREELTPCSDLDFAFLFEDGIDGNAFLLGLQKQILHTDRFASTQGFTFEPLPYGLDDAIDLEGKQLNAFLDMAPVYDPHGLSEEFRERIRASYDPFEHFLHVRDFWSRKWSDAADASENIAHFDIKNEGLRIFLAAVWTLAGQDFCHSRVIYQDLPDSRDLEAYDFLLRIRAFVHSRRTAPSKRNLVGDHPEDMLEFEDFMSFGEMLGPDAGEQERFEFANAARARLLAARRRISRFAKGVIGRELSRGVSISPESTTTFGQGGLFERGETSKGTDVERSRRALSLLVASQSYDVPIDDSELQNTYLNAGDWIVRVKELSSLFYDIDGNLSRSLEFLCQIDGVGERLFPGYALFEASIDERVLTEKESLRGKLARRKLTFLEDLIRSSKALPESLAFSNPKPDFHEDIQPATEVAMLDPDAIAAIRLALFTKRLPLTDSDLQVRNDTTADRFDRFSLGLSQIPLDDYYGPFADEAGFSSNTIDLTLFLVLNRRALKVFSEPGIMDEHRITEFAELCGSPARLRALFVFTSVDRAEWESESAYPTRWFNIKELYAKTQARFSPEWDPADALSRQGYDASDQAILRDFGETFFGGRYRRFANHFGFHVLRLAQDPESNAPKVSMLQDTRSYILGVCSRDNRGLAASICAALWAQKVEFGQAHLFSASSHRLALDFFHLTTPPEDLPPNLARRIETALSDPDRAVIDAESLPGLSRVPNVQVWHENNYCLRYEGDESPISSIFTLTGRLYLKLQADVFGVTARYRKSKAHIAIYFTPPPDLSREDLIAMAADGFQ